MLDFTDQLALVTSALTYLRATKAGQLDRIVPFQSPWPAMVHDIAIIDGHVVAFIGPLVWNVSGKGRAAWEPDKGTRVALVPRDARTADDVKWIEGPPFFN